MRKLQRARTAAGFGAVVLATLALSCGGDHLTLGAGVDPGTPAPHDAWLRRGIDPSVVLGELPTSDFCAVVEARQLEAQARLADRAWVPLTAEETTSYSGGKLRAPEAGGVPVLLRCVQASPHPDEHSNHDRTRVLGNAGLVLVQFSTLRAHFTPPLRRALVAIVSREPYDVYVDELVAIY